MDVYQTVDERKAQSSAMYAFMRFCEQHTRQEFPDYLALQAWAIADSSRFWQLFVRWSRLPFSGSDEPAVLGTGCKEARFFPHLRLNYARCLLRPLDGPAEDLPAIIGVSESAERTSLTRSDLLQAVERCAAGLVRTGVRAGDRIVAVGSNRPEMVIACLATSAIGAVWSSIAADFGEAAALDRFRQLDPVVLFSRTEYTAQGTQHSLEERISLFGRKLPTLRMVVALDAGNRPVDLRAEIEFTSFDQLGSGGRLRIDEWEDFPFDHPILALFTSGTTGAPKCLLHGAGGTLIEQYKEHVLHSSFGIGERLYYHTTAGWVMWNWQLSTLACGTEIVLLDGSPTFPLQTSLLSMIDQERVTIFGTSPTYLHAMQQLGVRFKSVGTFAHLHTLISTGSILYEAQYDWIASQLKDVKVQSISGGTDIVGCFALGNPLLPIYRGDSQCISLGLDVRAMTADGPGRHGEGDLVCANPFPSRPLGIAGDADGTRLHNAYFAENPGFWTHGDRIRLSEHGAARVLGRADGILNVRGIRVGPAEIYSIVLTMPEILNALAVEQRAPREPGGSRLVLLVVLQADRTLDRRLMLQIKKKLKQEGSPNHVPAEIVQLAALPVTHSGKLSERAVRDLLNGNPLSNRNAVKNPESLDAISVHPQLRVLA